MLSEVARVSASAVYDTLKKLGVTHLVWLPDTETGHMWEEMSQRGEMDIISISREGEALAIAGGLIATGKSPVILIQSTGLFESLDSMRGMGLDAELPILMLVGYRGYEEEKAAAGLEQTYSYATLLEPTLKAWNIPYKLLKANGDMGVIEEMYRAAKATWKPHIVLVCKEYTS